MATKKKENTKAKPGQKKKKKKAAGKARSARTGKYVSKKYADKHRDTTVVEKK